MDKNIVISIKTVLFIFFFLTVGYVIYRMGPIIAIVLVAALLMISLEHTIQFLMKKTLFNKPVPRSLAVIVTYLMLLLFLALVVTLIIPPVFSQAQKLFTSLSSILAQLNISTNTELSISTFFPQAASVSGGFLSATISLFSNVATFFTILVISIYISLDWVNIKKKIIAITPKKFHDEVEETISDVEVSVGMWLKGEAVLMTIVGTMCFTGLALLDVPYALSIGLLSGMLEAVPMIGPLISAVVAGVIGFSVSPAKGLAVVGVYILIQQLENNFIVPKVMGKVSGFSPLVILLALLIGTNFFGFVGAILAVPTTIILVIILKRVLQYSARD